MNIPIELTASDLAKLRLIHAAIKLFATKGIEGVSLRMVNREAGARNNSALHYHFGNKMGLITETISYIQDWFEKNRENQLATLELKAKTKAICVAEVMDVLIDPYVKLLETETWGHYALCALARFEFDGDEDVHHVLNQTSGKVARRLRGLLAKSCPDIPRKMINQRLNLSLFITLQGFANYKNHHQTYMGNLTDNYRAIGNQFKAFCVAGCMNETIYGELPFMQTPK